MGDAVIQFKGTIYEGGYGLIAKQVMRDKSLPKQSKLIYAYMCSFASISSNGERTAFPSVALQCAELGMSEDTYYKWRKPLIEKGLITITKTRSNEEDSKGQFDRNIYSIEPIPVPVVDEEIGEDGSKKDPYPKKTGSDMPYPNSSGTDNPYPNYSSTGKSSTKNTGTIKNSLKSNSFNKHKDTIDTKDTKSAINKENPFIHSLTTEEKERLKNEYMKQAFFENEEKVPRKLALVLQVFTDTPEQAEKYYRTIILAKNNVEREYDCVIWLEHEPELEQKIVNCFSRAIRKIERERNINNPQGYVYKSIYELISTEIADRNRKYQKKGLFFDWIEGEGEENFG
ncbi:MULTISPECIES: helix-turn-helix domain-containing protein [Siminovitchia]|uniref:Helix-turn-helix domain-containing protein n=1 Tax=Siminovitchia sediminis TaxID=1274353 RepID=A0ABW4KKI5_9BACI|nr:helix-turn-helix domain-containing protein [Siminovitchia fortis]